ncbi:hypothetical protein SPRA44_350118 [Serratia proteamaculans]|uniref:hypothetical protein n=1 Tax=Serratia proteamaculans TaxID=28151 RepID=UPI0009F7D493|nr:hypothetical protein [Serratia proteamaculans]SMB37104.1 hypothetical protein SPRA44_350118 [Serratia proteamaculans]
MENINNSTKLFTFKKTQTAQDNINNLFQAKVNEFQKVSLTNVQQQIATLVGTSVVYPEQVEMVLNSYCEANDRLLEIYEEFEAYQDIIAPSFLSVAVMEYMKSAGELVESLSRK